MLLHLLVVALFVATFFLGHWQLTKAEAGGGAVNWSYALQWPLYGFMGLWFYLRMVRIELHRDPDADEPGTDVVLYQRPRIDTTGDRKSTRLNSSHLVNSYAVFCLKKKITNDKKYIFT